MRPTPAIDKYIAPLFRTTGEKPLLFTLELELLGAPIPIKRTLKIPSNMNLGYVQEILMLAMGWEGYHLKEIRHGKYTYFVRLAGGQDPEPVEGFPQRDSFKYTLGDLLKEEWDSFIFVYDLGDAWKHRVTLTDIAPCKEEDAKEDAVAAYLVSGENACPPEDVGGVDGYAEALQSFNNPEDDEYDSIRRWMFAISKAFTRPLAGVLWGLFQVPVIQHRSYSNARTTIKIMTKCQFNCQIRSKRPNFHNKIAKYCYFIVKIRKLSLPLHTTIRQLTAMIQELKFKNFLSFRDEAVFSFEPTKDEPINRVAIMADGTKLLRFAVVFGANASGKSNFMEVFDFLRRFWTQVPNRNDLSTRVVPFLLDKETPNEDSSFEMKFYVGDVRYWYKLSLNKERVSSESLHFYESNRPTRIFWREYAEGKSVVNFNPAAVKLKATEVEAININCWKNMSLFASMTKVNISIPYISDVIGWINEKLLPGIDYRTELSGYAKEKMLKEEGFRQYLQEFIKTADLRIAEVKVKETVHTLSEQQLKVVSDAPYLDEEQKNEILSSGAISDIDTGFLIRVKNARGVEEYTLPESRQSAGTTRVIELESAIYTTINEQAFLPVDEVEASLHPFLLDFILDRFLKENDNRSQLLITTHYDPLLDVIDDLFGKDSVWFTEKKEDGNTELFPLTDFKGLNKLSSIRKSYKNGQFGAVPEIYV